jgi:hypothetical protein
MGGVAAGIVDALRLRPKLPGVALKQFRDAAAATEACFQAIVDSPIEITQFHGGGLYSDAFELQVTTCESHQIVRDLLGTAPNPGSTTLPVKWAAWISFDFVASLGRNISVVA